VVCFVPGNTEGEFWQTLTESEAVARPKYATVNIPVRLFVRIEKIIKQNNDFKTVADYVTFVLREAVIEHSAHGDAAIFNSEDLERLRERLVALGSLEQSSKLKR
jgi:hypothetical protein